jgi:hypothetical protein
LGHKGLKPLVWKIASQSPCNPGQETLEYVQYVLIGFPAVESEVAKPASAESLDGFTPEIIQAALHYDPAHFAFQLGIVVAVFDITFP